MKNSVDMNNEEFISRLKENKTEFKDEIDMVDYMLPCLQFYLENYQPIWYDMDTTKLNVVVDFGKITIVRPDNHNSIRLTQHAFNQLVQRVGEFE